MRDARPIAEGAAEPLRPAGGPPRPRVWPVLVAWCGLALGLALLVALSNPLSKGEYPGPDHLVRLGVLHGWYQFDAGWYEVIATRGYYLVTGQSPVAFFPAYPLAVRWLGGLFGGNVPLTAIAVTFACGAGAVGLFTLWVRDHLTPRAAR